MHRAPVRLAVITTIGVAALILLGADTLLAEDGRFTGSLQVDLVTVEVVVLDPDGRPVPGLSRSDFTLREDGAPQALTQFEEIVGLVARGPAPGEGERIVTRRVLVFLDWSRIAPPLRRSTTESLATAVAPLLDGTTTVSVMSFDGMLRLHGRETADPAVIEAALCEAGGNAAIVTTTTGGAANFAAAFSTLHERMEWFDDALEAAMRAGGGGDGRRIALVVTPGITPVDTTTPRAECRNLSCLAAEARWRASLAETFRYGLLGRTGHIASELGYTLFILDPTTSAHLDAGVDVSLSILASGCEGSESGSGLSRTGVAQRARLDSLRDAAAMTGGAAALYGDASRLIGEIDARTRSYYALVYQPPRTGGGETHAIQVEVRDRPDLTVVHRTRYLDRPIEERQTAALRSEMISSDSSDDLGARISLGKKSVRGAIHGGLTRLATVTVVVRVPLGALTLTPDGATASGAFHVSAFTYERMQQRSMVLRRLVPVNVPAATLEHARERGFWTFDIDVEVEADSPELRVGVADAVTGRSTVETFPLQDEI